VKSSRGLGAPDPVAALCERRFQASAVIERRYSEILAKQTGRTSEEIRPVKEKEGEAAYSA